MRVRVPAEDVEAIRRYEDDGYVIVGESLDESLADELDGAVCLSEAVVVVMDKLD
ncbi:MAG: hypothetical protein QOK28_2056 [Actinomycetota bacterium]|jgi:hypothetical protein